MLHELGARPWQNPPQYTTLEETVDFYISKMSTDEVANQVIDVLEMGIPVTDLAHVIQLANVMEGVHTVDVGVLVTPVLIEFIMLIGDSAGVKYETGLDEEDVNVSDAMIQKALRKFREEEASNDDKEEPEVQQAEPQVEEPSDMSGLMSRRS
jgi:hypothetical protein